MTMMNDSGIYPSALALKGRFSARQASCTKDQFKGLLPASFSRAFFHAAASSGCGFFIYPNPLEN
jgi:hypothetical protein